MEDDEVDEEYECDEAEYECVESTVRVKEPVCEPLPVTKMNEARPDGPVVTASEEVYLGVKVRGGARARLDGRRLGSVKDEQRSCLWWEGR
ncbi:hypothetical protein Pelo_18181 [Pelomyxa schiedti]|nr:hypothetical protein Pelo_18181 [Pelomyxa schiedti]